MDLESAERALRFYADRRNHNGVGISAVYNDRGEYARRALGPCEGCDGRGWQYTGKKVMDQDGIYDDTERCRDCWGSGIPDGKVVASGRTQE